MAIMRAAVWHPCPGPVAMAVSSATEHRAGKPVAASRATQAGGAVPVLVSPVSGRAWRWPGAAGCPACAGGSVLSVLRWLVSAQVGAGLAGAGSGGNRTMAGTGGAAPSGVEGVAARPGRQLPARGLLVPRSEQRIPHDADRCP